VAWPTLAGDHAPATAETISDGEEMRVRATLKAAWLEEGHAKAGVLFELDEGWHLYWRNPGDTGLAPRFEWQMSGAEPGEMEWPLPTRFEDAEIEMVSYGYEDEVLLAVPVRWRPGEMPEHIGVALHFLACASQCIPGTLELSMPFPARRSAEALALFGTWQERVPSPVVSTGASVVLEAPGSLHPDAHMSLELEVTPCPSAVANCPLAPDGASGIFYPHSDDAFGSIASAVSPGNAPGSFGVSLVAQVVDATAGDGTLRGVLVLDDSGTRRGIEIAVPWRAKASTAAGAALAVGGSEGARPQPARLETSTPAPAAAAGGVSLWRAAFLGFLGGLLLNLMPCVLPVLALKVFALTDLASRSRREVAWHVGGYTGGILLAMGVLAGFVIGLRAAGNAVGWGFHLQEPIFVVGVCCLLVAFALNLFGVFEINVDTTRLAGVGANQSGAVRSFFDGLLAVILATPCSAPFLGTAVGFAFASSGLVITAIFASIGLGLAAPFALVAAVPSWGQRMPRSGPWMLHLRAGLGFTLLASVVWLLWVLGRASGADAMAGALVVLVLVGLVAWAYGLLQQIGRPLPMPALLVALVAVGLMGVDLVDFAPPKGARLEVAAGSQPWDAGRVDAVLAQGRPAFVYFTADWCITCKLNEARVLDDPAVEDTLRTLQIPVFRGDWTRRDETIRGALAELGKAGVPAYALYQPHDPDNPVILPELLSVDRLVAELEQASVTAGAGIRRAGLSTGTRTSDTRL
jgi:thiol:disulfide interchange protein DsbD